MADKTIVITGTHLTPALALIEELQKHHWSVIYLGRKKLTRQLLSGQKIKIIYIASSKLQRFNWIYSLATGIKLPLGWCQALYHLKKIRPTVVISFGGYVSVPVVCAAKLLTIPIIIHEQTLKAGLANKLMARLADKIAISWPESHKYFSPAKTVLTGNPVRKSLLGLKKRPKPNLTKTIFISGGSQGSRFINQTVSVVLRQLLEQFIIIHQFGLTQSAQDWQAQQQFHQQLPARLQSRYQLQPWFPIKQLARKLNQADLIVSRAGINTVTELAVLNKPALLIPLPYTQKNEQLTNARWLAKLGLAKVLHQHQLTPDSLFSHIQLMINQLDRFKLRPEAFNKKLVRTAAARLYCLILEVSRAHN